MTTAARVLRTISEKADAVTTLLMGLALGAFVVQFVVPASVIGSAFHPLLFSALAAATVSVTTHGAALVVEYRDDQRESA